MNTLENQIGRYRSKVMGIAHCELVRFYRKYSWIWWHRSLYLCILICNWFVQFSEDSCVWGGYSKAAFYKRRFTRVVIPYCMIAVTWCGIQDLIINRSLSLFLYNLSTISFWIEYKGAWYVAMLIPVYLAFPWFYDWAEKKNRNIRVIASLIVAVVTSFGCFIFLSEIYRHLMQVFSSVIVYLIGYWYAGLDVGVNKNGVILSSICLLLFFIKSLTPLNNIELVVNLTWAMLGIPFTFISAWLLDKMNCKSIDTVLMFFGKYSLEMYLWNIFVIQAMNVFNLVDIMKLNEDTYGYVSYVIVVITGCLLSVIYGKLSGVVVQKIFSDLRKYEA